MRPLIATAASSLAIGLLALAGGFWGPGGMAWFEAHGAILLAGTLLPAIMALHVETVNHFREPLDGDLVQRVASILLVTAAVFGFGVLVPSGFIGDWLPMLGLIGVTAAAMMLGGPILRSVPKESVVDIEADPLTKGDDASWKHIKFAHFFLPLGLLMVIIASAPWPNTWHWASRLMTTGLHVLLVGYGLLSMYGLGHIWVPRFSGVPAIAAGAIKGELHSTLLGIVGLIAGFMTGIAGILVGLGFFVFVGFFTYMGVLGANIMRNKSKTQRVTPEFGYIPWTFTGIFWLISAVLLGMFMGAATQALPLQASSLSYTHVHIALVGGILQLLLSWAIPLAARIQQRPLPPFSGVMKGAFFAFNGGLSLALFAHFVSLDHWGLPGGAGLIVLGLVLFVRGQNPKTRTTAAPA